jgi:glycosyltransferase involved in cell wall biosynthesis
MNYGTSLAPRMTFINEALAPAHRKPTVVFVGFTALAVGSGTEQFLLNVIRYAPTQEYRVVVVQTDFLPSRRWSEEYVAESMRAVELITLRSSKRFLDPDRLLDLASKSLWMYALAAVTRPFFRSASVRRTRRNNQVVLRSIESSDLIYLVHNEDRGWLHIDPSRTLVVGSTHVDDLSGGLLAFGSLPGRSWLQRLYRRARRRSRGQRSPIDAFHITQRVYWRERLKRTGLDALIPLGVDTAKFRPGTPRPPVERIRFLFVGGLESSKGLDRLLAAWNQVRSPRGELHIVGHGRLAGMVEDRAQKDPRIVVHGILPPDTIADMYRSCDVFLLPSRFETLGLVVLEALSSGLYVVASEAVRGVFDDFQELGALEYLDFSAPALARRLQDLSEGAPPLDDARREALHHVLESSYDWKRVSADLFAWFGQLLERRPPPNSAAISPP